MDGLGDGGGDDGGGGGKTLILSVKNSQIIESATDYD